MIRSKAGLIEAIQSGNAAQAVAMLEREPQLAARVANGPSAALLAQYYGYTELARELIARGAEVDVFAAAGCGQVERLILLDAEPGCVNAFSDDGYKPLGLAEYFGHTEAAPLLLFHGAEVRTPARNRVAVTPLHSAAAGGRAEIVMLLLAHGADVNARQVGGFTPLHSAAQNGDMTTARQRLQSGADANARAQDGATPLMLAGEQRLADNMELMCSFGAVD